jgi:hypothetical protein
MALVYVKRGAMINHGKEIAQRQKLVSKNSIVFVC